MTENSLESALSAIEREADIAVRSLGAALKEAKKVKAAAAVGHVRELRQALNTTAELASQAADAAKLLQAGWTFDEELHFAGGAFTKEILALAAEEGLAVFESDERLLSYPAIVVISPGDVTVVIDKKKERRVRPTVLVATLKALQSRGPKFKAEAFLEALGNAYDHVVAKRDLRPGAIVKLADIYSVLTLLPGSGRDYTRQEFARDLYLLDQSGVTTTRDKRMLSLPASALTRGSGVFITVARSGQEKVYAGMSLEAGHP